MSTRIPRRSILLSSLLPVSLPFTRRSLKGENHATPGGSGHSLRASVSAEPTDIARANSHTPNAKPTGIVGEWKLVFHDEFEGAQIDRTRWHMQYPWGEDNNGDGSLNCYLPENVALDGNGHLALTGREGLVAGTGSNGKQKSWSFSSGQINTWGIFSILHGAVEIRAKVPSGSGTWPAFWALPADGSWPPEVDVMEIYGDMPGVVEMTYHRGTPEHHQENHSTTTLPMAVEFSEDYHVFGCSISAEAITWYLDGREQWAYRNNRAISELKPMYLVCNLAIGGMGGNPSGTTWPVQCLVDYIRAWEPVKSARLASAKPVVQSGSQ